MTWGPHIPLDEAYRTASIFIREAGAIKAQTLAVLANEVNGDVLMRLWEKVRAHGNDLRNIRSLVPGVMIYAGNQHPLNYDIKTKWEAAETAYSKIADEIEKVLLTPDGTIKRTRIVNKAVEAFRFTAVDTAAIRALARTLPDVER